MPRQNSSNKHIAVLQKLDTKRRCQANVSILIVIIALVAVIVVYNVRRSRKRAQATAILEDLRELDQAIDQYAIERSGPGGMPIHFTDVLWDIKTGSRLYTSGGKDILGNPFTITVIDEFPKLSDTSYKALSDVAPADFWSPFR